MYKFEFAPNANEKALKNGNLMRIGHLHYFLGYRVVGYKKHKKGHPVYAMFGSDIAKMLSVPSTYFYRSIGFITNSRYKSGQAKANGCRTRNSQRIEKGGYGGTLYQKFLPTTFGRLIGIDYVYKELINLDFKAFPHFDENKVLSFVSLLKKYFPKECTVLPKNHGYKNHTKHTNHKVSINKSDYKESQINLLSQKISILAKEIDQSKKKHSFFGRLFK